MRKTYNGWANYATWAVAQALSAIEENYRPCLEASKAAHRARRVFRAADAEALAKALMPNGPGDLEARARPYAGVRWGAIAFMIRHFANKEDYR